MDDAVVHEVLVDLVGHDDRVVLVRQLDEQGERLAGEGGAGRVVRVVDEDQAGAIGDRRAEVVVVGLEVGTAQRHGRVDAAREVDHGAVLVVERLEGEHLVALVDEGEHGRGDRLGRAGGDQHLAVRVETDSVEAPLVLGDGRAQRGDAGRRRVLVDARGDRRTRGLEHLGGAVVVGEALAQVDRPGAGREALISAKIVDRTEPSASRRRAPRAARCQEPLIVTEERYAMAVQTSATGLDTGAGRPTRPTNTLPVVDTDAGRAPT